MSVYRVSPAPLPDQALLQRSHQRAGCYTDCFALDLPGEVRFAAYVTAFYTSPLFRVDVRSGGEIPGPVDGGPHGCEP